MNRVLFFWLSVDTVLTFAGDVFLKKWSIQPSWATAACALACWGAMLLTQFPIMRNTPELARIGAISLIASMFCSVTVGAGIFGEALTQQNKVGLILGAIAVALLA